MGRQTAYVGLDVHQETITMALIPECRTFPDPRIHGKILQ